MSNVLTSFRQAIVTQLDSGLQSGSFTVVAGERDGAVKDRKLCHVFAAQPALDADKAFLLLPLIVRAWLPKPRQPKPRGTSAHQTGSPEPDPEPLEQLMLDLITTLTPIRNLSSIGVTFELREDGVIDYEDWGVQVTLVGWAARTLP